MLSRVPCAESSWLSILNIAVCTWPSQTPYHFPLATISSFSKSASLCFVSKFICIISFQIPHIRGVMPYFSYCVWLFDSVWHSIGPSIDCKWHYFILFNVWLILHVCMYHIFFIQSSVSGHLDCFRWTFRLLPCLGCCKQCYNEHWGTCILLHHVFSRYVPKSGGTPLWYSCLENPIDGGAWKAAVHGVAEGRTWLSDVTFTFHFQALEKEMATHSSVLAWRIPVTGEPGGLPSMGSHRVGHDWSYLAW